MTIYARSGVVSVALAAVMMTAACNEAPAPPATTMPVSTAASTQTSTTTSTPADPQLAAAEAVVARFWSLVDALGADPQRSLDELTTVSRDQTLDTWRELLTQRRRQGHRQVGSIAIVSSKASSSGGKLAVDTCIDVSKANLVDKNGKSVVAATRSPRLRYTYVVQEATDGKFYVMQDKVVGTC